MPQNANLHVCTCPKMANPIENIGNSDNSNDSLVLALLQLVSFFVTASVFKDATASMNSEESEESEESSSVQGSESDASESTRINPIARRLAAKSKPLKRLWCNHFFNSFGGTGGAVLSHCPRLSSVALPVRFSAFGERWALLQPSCFKGFHNGFTHFEGWVPGGWEWCITNWIFEETFVQFLHGFDTISHFRHRRTKLRDLHDCGCHCLN